MQVIDNDKARKLAELKAKGAKITTGTGAENGPHEKREFKTGRKPADQNGS